MTLDLDNMTQAEFDELIVEIKEKYPKLFQFLSDFVDRKVTYEEVDGFLKMEQVDRVEFINNYQARN
ncbi:hypothetical protein [Streptococcus infantis]|jgi:hypothetical protein|uniref:hypothetical protein n=1 Tax=Streptococcus infantis TaxID=68892 RepID=UPI001CBF318C|nr:hypothetical protein [Streptococcus infantis]MBZ2120842.1 hypothetical protein [Streptococcus infantis]MBZ2122660.1 hypothetical protein [Streptococcus infantis]MBZ2126434.1 hypothetical protein [Streptococcus infantis]DAS52222.1 MAG TPA: Stationary phase protein 4 [Caudoviricetes sp.]